MKYSDTIPSIYVIVVTHNALEWLDRCFTSIYESTILLNVIVFDNASNDTTVAQIVEKFPNIILIESSKNLGFGKANNIAIEKAFKEGADYVFLLNQDAWVEIDTISTLVKIAQKKPDYGIISPLHLNGEGNDFDYGFYSYISICCSKLFLDIILDNKKELYDVTFVNAAAWLISKKCIESVGGFSPIFFHYGEDYDYSNRLKYHQLKIGINADTKIYHDRANRISRTNFNEITLQSKLILSTNINHISIQYKVVLQTLFNILRYALLLRHRSLIIEIFCFKFLILNFNKILNIRKRSATLGTSFLNN